jgi:DNA topoisomerase VI subunit B
MRTPAGSIDARPSKGIFRSIIADYDMPRAICELVDNSLDIWHRGKRAQPLTIDIELDVMQRALRVADNAGGVKQEELKFVFGPGQSGNQPTDQVIGIFGVGTMRAVVALAQHVRVQSRHAASQGGTGDRHPISGNFGTSGDPTANS